MNAEQATELRQSVHWTNLVEELDKRVEYESLKLKTCKPEDLLSIQARIAVWEAITRLPGDIIERES